MSDAAVLEPETPRMPPDWHLGAESWPFHRLFYKRLGRAARPYEYTGILWQIRQGSGEELARYKRCSIYRVKLIDGETAIVRGNRQYLMAVLPSDWEAPAVKLIAAEQLPVAKPLRSSTLTLGNASAAKAVLAKRLRQNGVKPEAVMRVSPR